MRDFWFWRFIDFLLYSNLFIAICALAMAWQTSYLLHLPLDIGRPIWGFIGFATWAIYALHRLFSLKKIDVTALHTGRFRVIAHYQRHIRLYAAFSFLGCIFFFTQLRAPTQWSILLPAAISLAYVLPIWGPRRLRLRDVNFVKIFLIALVWAYVTVALPILELGQWQASYWWICIERAFFIFAITLPFDIRDWPIDAHNSVRTLPQLLGLGGTRFLAGICLFTFMVLFFSNYETHNYFSFSLYTLIVYLGIYYSPYVHSDYYFTGGLDGSMFLQSICVLYLAW